MWMTPNLPVFFKFNGSRSPAIDRDWLELLMASADSTTGLVLTNAKRELLRAGAFRRYD